MGGAARRRTRPQRGSDVEHPLEVTLEEAYTGTSRTISMQVDEPCPACNSTGIVRNAPCLACRGMGTVRNAKRLEVKIPAGVNNGSRVRIAGKGESGRGGASGDLYLKISIKPHNIFERRGDDLHVEIPVPLTAVMLGGEVQVPTPAGRLSLKVPPETQNGKVFRLAGQGMPHLGNSTRGAIFARTKVVLPAKISEEEKNLFQRLKELRKE